MFYMNMASNASMLKSGLNTVFDLWQLQKETFCFFFKTGFLICPTTDPKIKDWIVKGWLELYFMKTEGISQW